MPNKFYAHISCINAGPSCLENLLVFHCKNMNKKVCLGFVDISTYFEKKARLEKEYVM